MELKHNEKTIISVKYKDLEKFIEAVYDIEYCLPRAEESSNDVILEFSVEKDVIEDWEVDYMKKWQAGEFETDGNRMTSAILNDLCDKGLIKEGAYYIDVSW